MSQILLKDRTKQALKRGDIATILADPDYSTTHVKAIILASEKGSRFNTYTVTILPLYEPYLNLLKKEANQTYEYYQKAPKIVNATTFQFIKTSPKSLDLWEKKIYDQMVPLL